MNTKQTEGDLNTLTKQMLSKILIASPERIFIYDVREQRNIFSNRTLAKFLGYPPEQKREMGADQFHIIIHPEDSPRLDEHYRTISESKTHGVFESIIALRTRMTIGTGSIAVRCRSRGTRTAT